MHSIRWLTYKFADWECHPDRCLSYFYVNYWTYHNGLWRGILDRDGACVSGTAVLSPSINKATLFSWLPLKIDI